MYITYLHQDKSTKICKLDRWFSKYAKTTSYCAVKQKIDCVVAGKRHKNKGRPGNLILEDYDIIDQRVELLKKIKNFLHQAMCYRSLIFKN